MRTTCSNFSKFLVEISKARFDYKTLVLSDSWLEPERGATQLAHSRYFSPCRNLMSSVTRRGRAALIPRGEGEEENAREKVGHFCSLCLWDTEVSILCWGFHVEKVSEFSKTSNSQLENKRYMSEFFIELIKG